ncbi:c-type cytochrome [Brevundimonas pishanensis]|uniref:c-type cytochrome n=1 Tax=Brevundimonas pishanensis TaxID=2896315 RepID=UPI001FA70E59|nr:c-type cytochrome [Brevundimonas pishanensis]
MRFLSAVSLTVPVVLASCAEPEYPRRTVAGADAARGLELVRETGCAACHDIPQVRWPKGRSGPPLAGIGTRPLIAGRIPNQPDAMGAFIQDAPSLVPGTAMPAMPLNDRQARDVAAFLYTLDDD